MCANLQPCVPRLAGGQEEGELLLTVNDAIGGGDVEGPVLERPEAEDHGEGRGGHN